MNHKTKTFALFAFVIGLFLLTFNQSTKAQSALDGFDPNANGIVRAIVVQADGKIIIGGGFTTVLGVTRNRIARLNADGTLDTAFNPNADNLVVNTIAVQPDGKILVGGDFTTIGGQTRNRIARLDASNGLADSWNPNANNTIQTIAVQSDGKILAGGDFTNIGGQARNRIARLDATTGTADSFNPNANNAIYSIAVQSDGKILVGGGINGANSIGGQTRNFIARLNGSTGLADSFNPNADGTVNATSVQSDGKIIAGGLFANIGGQVRGGIARLDATTGAADSFNPNATGGFVNAIALQPDGKVLVGGDFTGIGGQTRSLFARLSNNTAALSTLAGTTSTVTLTRDGSGAQFNRVIFEQSIDNGATYTLLGTATNSFTSATKGEKQLAPQAAGYTLTGLTLPTGQNILIRARGFYNTGYQTGSQTIEDKVQTAYLLAPSAASVSVSGKVQTSNGRGISRAIVTINDGSGEIRTATTNQFGYFQFNDVLVGETYIFEVRAKGYSFAPQVLNIAEDTRDLNFTAQ